MVKAETITAKKYVFAYDPCATSDNQRRRALLVLDEIHDILDDVMNPGSGLLQHNFHLVYDPATLTSKEEARVKHKLAEIDAILQDRSI